jgi:hypothetical protein
MLDLFSQLAPEQRSKNRPVRKTGLCCSGARGGAPLRLSPPGIAGLKPCPTEKCASLFLKEGDSIGAFADEGHGGINTFLPESINREEDGILHHLF